MRINLKVRIVLIVLSLLLIAGFIPLKADDNNIYVCRDMSLESIRLEFRNLPEEWLSDQVSWWYLADGATLKDNTLIADALVDYPVNNDDIVPGMAIIGAADYSIEIRGNADSLPCESEATPTPTETEVISNDDCPAWSFNSLTGSMICLWDLPRARQ